MFSSKGEIEKSDADNSQPIKNYFNSVQFKSKTDTIDITEDQDDFLVFFHFFTIKTKSFGYVSIGGRSPDHDSCPVNLDDFCTNNYPINDSRFEVFFEELLSQANDCKGLMTRERPYLKIIYGFGI